MKRNAFGQLVPANPRLRFFAPTDDTGTGGDSEFKAPESQEELNKLINGAVARTHKQYESLKEKASKWDAHEAESNKPKPVEPTDKSSDKPSSLSTDDVQKQINDALAAERKELALERVSDRLDKALEGRNVSASKLFALDREQFIKDDGKNVDHDALKTWVEENSTEVAGPAPRRLRGQGERDSNVTGGSVQAGRDLFDSAKKPTRKE